MLKSYLSIGDYIYCFLPYLKTSEQVKIRDITLYPSQGLNENSHFSEEIKKHINTLASTFYLINDKKIQNPTYTVFDTRKHNETEIIQQINDVKQLISYLYSSPHFPGGSPFLEYEHSDIFIFIPERIVKSLTGLEDIEENSIPWLLDGYHGIRNMLSHLWVAEGSRIYPSIPYLTLNLSQDLKLNFHSKHNPGFNNLVINLANQRKKVSTHFRNRIFNSIEWYNRSCSGLIDPEVSLVELSTAFECLFQLSAAPELTSRFKETIFVLLGYNERLESWVEQFYNARSKILHQGHWPHINFYATENQQYKKIVKHNEDGIPYRTLSAYGRQIFRICLQTILFGLSTTEGVKLTSLFYRNQERLELICRKLNTTSANFQSVFADVYDTLIELNEYSYEADTVNIDTAISTGVKLIEIYLKVKDNVPPQIKDLICEITNKHKEIPIWEVEELFEKLSELFSQYPFHTNNSISQSKVFDDSLRLYFKYITSPIITLYCSTLKYQQNKE